MAGTGVRIAIGPALGTLQHELRVGCAVPWNHTAWHTLPDNFGQRERLWQVC